MSQILTCDILMTFCTTCGTKNKESDSFCGSCGASLGSDPPQQTSQEIYQSQPTYQQPAQPYTESPSYQPSYLPGQLPPRTGWLTFVIVLSWLGIIAGGIFGLLLLGAFPAFGFVILLFVGLGIWLVRELSNYNNTARIIQLVLTSLGLLSSLSTLDIIGLILGGMIVYALAFHKETVALFQPGFQHQQNRYQTRY
jgi:hypothetical protein